MITIKAINGDNHYLYLYPKMAQHLSPKALAGRFGKALNP